MARRVLAVLLLAETVPSVVVADQTLVNPTAWEVLARLGRTPPSRCPERLRSAFRRLLGGS